MIDSTDDYLVATPLDGAAVLLVHRDGTRVVASVDAEGRLWIDRRRHGEATRRSVIEPQTRTSIATSLDPSDGSLLAPTGGVVRRIDVEVGDAVATGDLLVTLEAMKMQIEVRATMAGVVESIDARSGERVERGARVLRIRASPRGGVPG